MITLIKNYPYDNTYEYVKNFSDKNSQNSYFNSLEQITLADTEYVKDYKSIRVPFNCEELINEGVNYVIFENDEKTMFAFITDKNYINEGVTELIYEIDVFNSFLFDISLDTSFIERKVCNISEISDFDEGLYIGEHDIVEQYDVFQKTSNYFAMFNGFKEQELIFNDNNKLISVADIPYSTSKPLTLIDNVPYPLYFMPLKDIDTYATAIYEDIGISSGGSEVRGDAISKKLFRFLKGYEAFASESYLDSGGVPTIGYGITESNSYWNSLFPLCDEEKASNVLAEVIYNSFAVPLYERMREDGIDMATVKQNHFDAFLSLAFNGGLGAVTESPMYLKFCVNQNDTSIVNDWATWYIRDNNGTVLQGLKNRRNAEISIFRDNEYQFKPIGIVDSSGVISSYMSGDGHIPAGLGGEL